MATQLVQTPVVHVAQLLYWQQRPATHWFDVHQSFVLHVPPLALSGWHCPPLRYSFDWQDVHTPVVHVVQPETEQQLPAVQRPLVHQPSAEHVPPSPLSG